MAGRALILVAVAGGASNACASRDAQAPEATLPHSLEAEAELRPILSAWAHGRAADRIALEPTIAAFGARRGGDEASRIADVMLAWIALEKGQLQVAQEEAERVRKGAPPGTVTDLARTMVGASLRRQGKAEDAYLELSPLVSKLIDPWARALFNEEIVRAAVDAGRSQEALVLMRVWLREAAPEDRPAVESVVREALARTGRDDLLALLARPPSDASEDITLRKLVAGQLAVVARKGTGDVALAQELLARAPALLGEDSERVAELASGARKARVEARTVGLLLDLRDEASRRRGAEVLRGATFGLGLPGSSARLVSRDAHGREARGAMGPLNEALAALSADGASVIIAGADEQEAEVAATFADAHHVPVLLLTPPTQSHTSGASFVVGVGRAELEAAILAGLAARGATPIGVVTEDPDHARATLTASVTVVRSCREAAASWVSSGVASVALFAGPECAREALAKAPASLHFAADLEGSDLPLPAGSFVATAGAFPFAPGAALIGDWLRDRPSPPSYWSAVARDAATLAWAAVQGLPAEGTEEPAEVTARRARTATALATVTAPLWTTEASGFRGAHTLPRTLGLREVAKPAR